MAFALSKTGITNGQTIRDWHVTQSIDAFVGDEAYDITISGSLTVIGPSNITGNTTVDGDLDITGTLTFGELELDNLTVNINAQIHRLDADSASVDNLFATGSLNGSASYATSSSYARNTLSASYALTASYVQNAQSASYVLNAISSSYALSASYASTASYVRNAQSASYVPAVISASYALSASYAPSTASTSKVYLLTFSVSGGVITEISSYNELGGTPVLIYTSLGQYRIRITNKFTSGKTIAIGQYIGTDGTYVFNCDPISNAPDDVIINVADTLSQGYSDPASPMQILITVYN